MAVCLTGPRRHWVVLGSFTPRPLLWDSELSSTRVKWFLLKSDFRFSKILSPGEPLQSRWSRTAPEDFKVTRRNSFETLCPLLLQFPILEISLWINTYTWRSYFYSQLILLLQDTPKFSLLFRESFELTALLFFVTWIPLRIILALIEYPLIPQLFMCFTMVFEILFDPPKILNSLLLCNTCLLALWMLSICLAIFVSILRHRHFDPIDSACVRMHTIIYQPF